MMATVSYISCYINSLKASVIIRSKVVFALRILLLLPLLLSASQSAFSQISELPSNTAFRQHLIARITYGNTPSLDAEVKKKGSSAFLTEQLNPYPEGRPSLDLPLPKPYSRIEGLQTFVVEQMLQSPHQLNELMTQFWENHFNTLYRKTFNANYFELRDNQRFRIAALGRFRNLLDISGKSPSMMTYLDNRHNVKHSVGENYARELLELHTLGVNGGYKQADVEAVAEIFTGWSVANRQFRFMPDRHVTGFKRFMGKIIRGGNGQDGILEGQELLDILAQHPSTASHICGKLIQFFVTEEPAEQLQFSCAQLFVAQSEHPDQMAKVVSHLLHSSEFLAASQQEARKFTTPLRYTLRIARLFDIDDKHWVNRWLTRQGMPLFDFALPTGYSDKSDDWMSPAAQIQRIRFAADTTEFAKLKAAIFGSGGASALNRQLQLLSAISQPTAAFRQQFNKLAQTTNGAKRQTLLASLIASPEAQLH